MFKNRQHKNGITKTQGAQAAGALRAAFAPCAHPALFFKKISTVFFTKGGQQVIEYALVITAISAALTIMYVYTKRGLQSVIKSAVDTEIGTQRDSGAILSTGDAQTASSTSFAAARDNSRVRTTGGARQSIFNSASESIGNGTTTSSAFKGGSKNCVYTCLGVGCEVCP